MSEPSGGDAKTVNHSKDEERTRAHRQTFLATATSAALACCLLATQPKPPRMETPAGTGSDVAASNLDARTCAKKAVELSTTYATISVNEITMNERFDYDDALAACAVQRVSTVTASMRLD